MVFKLVFFILTVSGVIVDQIAGQDGCQPYMVTHMRLYDDILTWEEYQYETCEISHYIVTIESMQNRTSLVFNVTERRLDVTFLAPCEEYSFVVTKISTDNLAGSGLVLNGTITPPPEADLSIQYLILSQMPSWVELEWAIDEQWKSCATRYRVLFYDEDHDYAESVYVSSSNISLTYLAPCTSYTLAVTAVFNLDDEGPPRTIRYRTIAVAPLAPTLRRLDVHSTRIEMTWELVNIYVFNKCPVTSVNIDAFPYFAVSYPVQDDTNNRRPFNVTLPDLTPDTMYYLNVTLTNTAGISPGVPILIQTLESD